MVLKRFFDNELIGFGDVIYDRIQCFNFLMVIMHKYPKSKFFVGSFVVIAAIVISFVLSDAHP